MPPTTTQPDTPDPRIAALVTAQAASRATLTAQAEAMVAAQAAGFTGWYDSEAITAWAAVLAVRVGGLQRVAAQVTDAYLARVLALMAGRPVRPIGRVDVAELRQGVTHAGAYARAADVYRYQQSQFDRFSREMATATEPRPFTLVDPVAAAVDRVRAVADMDIQLADRAQTTAVYAQAADKGLTTGYRRVIHPERSKGGTCGLCIAASDRLYGPREPKAVHARCFCTTLPVVDNADPGSVLNRADLKALYRHAGGTDRVNLKAARYQINEHGELGPVLSERGSFRTARQAKRNTADAPRPKSDAEKAATLRKLRESMTPALARAQSLAKDDPKWGEYVTKLEARVTDLDHQLAA